MASVLYVCDQTWVLQNYSDSGKTKTVTRRKYDRIVNVLSGDEPPTADNSKFRCWIKAKGFKLGDNLPATCLPPSLMDSPDIGRLLFMPAKQTVSFISDFETKSYFIHFWLICF